MAKNPSPKPKKENIKESTVTVDRKSEPNPIKVDPAIELAFKNHSAHIQENTKS